MNRCLIVIASFVCISAATLLQGCTPSYVVPAGSIPASGTVTTSVPSAGLSFSSAAAQTFTVSEVGYSGSFTAKSSNTAVVTVAQTSSTTSARRRDTTTTTTTTFTVTPVGGGPATITVSDQNGNSTSIPVSVTSAVFSPELQR